MFSLRLIFLTTILTSLLIGCNDGKDQNEARSESKEESMKTEKLIIGTYTGEGADESKGIYLVSRDVETGSLRFDSLLTKVENPTFQVISPNCRFVYSVSETSDKGWADLTYDIQTNNSMKLNNQQPSLTKFACHVNINNDQTKLFVANYTSGVFTY